MHQEPPQVLHRYQISYTIAIFCLSLSVARLLNMSNKTNIDVRRFTGGTCEIEPVEDEPGRFWVKVRFDAQGGAGVQFEVWEDEMHMLEKDIASNFAHAQLVTLHLPAPTK